jgi:hypothetical protein
MTTNGPGRPGAAARAERRLLVQLTVAAVSMATLAVSWLGISHTERATVSQPIAVQAGSTTTSGSMTTLVPAPASSGATTVRRSRAS